MCGSVFEDVTVDLYLEHKVLGKNTKQSYIFKKIKKKAKQVFNIMTRVFRFFLTADMLVCNSFTS